MFGTGAISGDTITFTDAVITDGPSFGPDFDPEAVNRRVWGDFTFRFNEDGTMDVTYAGPPEWGSGEFKAGRIANLAGLDTRRSKITTINPGITGSWYDPSHDGEGWLIEILPGDLAIVYWFSYDTNGNQAWWVGVGTVEGKTIRVDETEIPGGTVFGPNFDPDDLVRVPWGSMEFTFDSCTTGTMSYESKLSEYGSGTLNLERITTVAGLPCE